MIKSLFFVALLTLALIPSSVLGQIYPPDWVNDPNACLGYQFLPNRTYSYAVEYGRSTDFTDPGDCARWCGWVEGCMGLEWVHHITSTSGGCYDITRPCCIIYTYVEPDFGYLQNCQLIDTAIVQWVDLREDLTCDPSTLSLNMALYYRDPYIWYDYSHPACCCGEGQANGPSASSQAVGSIGLSSSTTSSSTTSSSSSTESSSSISTNATESWSSRLNAANAAHS